MNATRLEAAWTPGTEHIVIACSDGHRHPYDVVDLLEFRQQLDEVIDRALSSGVVIHDSRTIAYADLDDTPEHSS